MTSIAEIQREVANRFGTPLIDMVSRRLARKVARPRQVAMYLASELTVLSLPAIGRHFGNRDHSTVMHAIKRIEELASADTDFGERVSSLRKVLSGGESA